MNIATFGFIVFGVLLNAVAQLLLKAGARNVGEIHLTLSNLVSVGLRVATQLPIIGGLTCYVLSVVLWIIALSRVDVSVAYPMLSLGYVVTAIGAWYLFGEALSVQRLLAIFVILIGVAWLART
ncbi:Small Multidrug Resistance protein [Duganella sp. CF402]|uniref:SMR family transporter n=1 Tax=unclassified Duganella TaxID=2636909 RepID=UPI0008CEB6AA|nr:MULTISPECIES: SMR family transporter [unclassified Duganella]RZT09247.1 Small Multidrug Resistance (SMR) protein [Duganella sp. BK701]SEL64798.1 Small Multidrug Resistance protein [Duganella sp. CF402]